ncbi:hypothetical protein V7121_15865 [Neobacillus drentensis]
MEKRIRSSEGMIAFRTEAEKNKMLEELDKLGEVARKMRGPIRWIKTAPWYEAVWTFQSTVLPPIMTSDPRYRDFAGKMKLSIDTLVVRSKVVMEVLDKMLLVNENKNKTPT